MHWYTLNHTPLHILTRRSPGAFGSADGVAWRGGLELQLSLQKPGLCAAVEGQAEAETGCLLRNFIQVKGIGIFCR